MSGTQNSVGIIQDPIRKLKGKFPGPVASAPIYGVGRACARVVRVVPHHQALHQLAQMVDRNTDKNFITRH